MMNHSPKVALWFIGCTPINFSLMFFRVYVFGFEVKVKVIFRRNKGKRLREDEDSFARGDFRCGRVILGEVWHGR